MHFPSTHWSLLAKASVNGDSESSRALEELCQRYWEPVRLFIRSRGISESEAEDLAQDFIVHLIEKSTFRRADRMKGRFRSFLLGALVRFLGDKADARAALKRGGKVQHVSLDESVDVGTEISPEAAIIFDREWAVTVLETALKRVKREYSKTAEGKTFDVLKRFLPGAAEPLSYDEAAAKAGLSVGALKSEIHRLRRRFRGFVHEEVAQTVSAPHEIEAEMAHLQRVLMDRSNQFGPVHET